MVDNKIDSADFVVVKNLISDDDREILKKYCRGVSVELGTYMGGTTGFLAPLCDVIYTIDIFEDFDLIEDAKWRENYIFEFKGQDRSYATTNKNLSYFNNVICIKGRTHDHYDIDNVDFIFIDADHSYEGVKKDFNAWIDKVKIGGNICFHDSFNRELYGVPYFLDELKTNVRVKYIDRKGSTTVWEKVA